MRNHVISMPAGRCPNRFRNPQRHAGEAGRRRANPAVQPVRHETLAPRFPQARSSRRTNADDEAPQQSLQRGCAPCPALRPMAGAAALSRSLSSPPWPESGMRRADGSLRVFPGRFAIGAPPSADHVGAAAHPFGNGQAERLGGVQIDDEFVLLLQFDRDVQRLRAA